MNQHIRAKCLELGEWVNAKKIVYLDTKFWLILRDVSLKRDESPDSKELYAKVTELAAAGICIFPISEDTFLEVIKQSDTSTLYETTNLIDLLSSGVSMISLEERLSLEFKYFTGHSIGKNVHDYTELAWTKLAYTLGFSTPVNEHIGHDRDIAIQKAFIDYMWSIPMSEIVDTMRRNGGITGIDMPKLSDQLNDGKFSHMHENRSFKQMFLSELSGMLDEYCHIFSRSLADMLESTTGAVASEEEIADSESAGLLRNAIYNIFKLNKSKDYFPSIRIQSGLYAAVRWDTKQKFQDNDIHDFRHAASAIAYCDVFFTERRLAHLVTQNATGYDMQYACNVQSTTRGAVKALSALMA